MLKEKFTEAINKGRELLEGARHKYDKKHLVIAGGIFTVAAVVLIVFGETEQTTISDNLQNSGQETVQYKWHHFFKRGCSDGRSWGFMYGMVRNKNLSTKMITRKNQAWEVCGIEKNPLPENTEFERDVVLSKQAMEDAVKEIAGDRDKYAEHLIFPQAIRMIYSPYKEKKLMSLRWDNLSKDKFEKISQLPKGDYEGLSPYDLGKKMLLILEADREPHTLAAARIIMANYIDIYKDWFEGDIQKKLAEAARLKINGMPAGETDLPWDVVKTLTFVRARQAAMNFLTKTSQINPEYVQIVATISKDLIKLDKELFSYLQINFDRKYWAWNPMYNQNLGDVIGLTSFLYMAKQEYTEKQLRTPVKVTEYELEVEEKFINSLLQKIKQQAVTIQGAAEAIKTVRKALIGAGFMVDMFDCLKIVRGSNEITELTNLLDNHLNGLIRDGIIRNEKELMAEIEKITKIFEIDDPKIIFPEAMVNKIALGLAK